jgi:two-component system nitrogen regulation response regulator GlnG
MQGMLHASGSVLMPAFLSELSAGTSDSAATGASVTEPAFRFEEFIRQRLESGSTNRHGEAHLELDGILLRAALRFTAGNPHKAANVLGLARQTLRLRLRELGITVTRNIGEEDEDAG